MEFKAKSDDRNFCKIRVRHFILLPICMVMVNLIIAAPYLSGKFDPVAQNLSQAMGVVGALGLLPAVIGIIWIVYEINRVMNNQLANARHRFAIVTVVTSAPAICVFILIAFVAFGITIAIIVCAAIILVGLKFTSYLSKWKTIDKGFCVIPFYFLIIPLTLVLFQIIFATHLTDSCRNRVINSAEKLITEIEKYYDKNGFYPDSLLAVNHDYEPNVIGIDGYHYAKSESTYNLYFVQPRFIFDDFGTREYVVYNPADTHTMYSHDGWILYFSPTQAKANQGWYATGTLDKPHWKYFLFD